MVMVGNVRGVSYYWRNSMREDVIKEVRRIEIEKIRRRNRMFRRVRAIVLIGLVVGMGTSLTLKATERRMIEQRERTVNSWELQNRVEETEETVRLYNEMINE